MKKLIIIALFIPLLSAAQQFECSDMMGCSVPFSKYPGTDFNAGFSNQLSAIYLISGHFSAGVTYEFNNWKAKGNSLGITADARFGMVYFGADVSSMYISDAESTFTSESYFNSPISITSKAIYTPAAVYGIHAGLYQKLGRHLLFKEQAGLKMAHIFGLTNDPYQLWPGTNASENTSISQSFDYYYLTIGLAYRL